MQSKTNQAV